MLSHNQRPGAGLAASVSGAHAGASDADYSAGTGATRTARAPLCRVSFLPRVVKEGRCNCCYGKRVQPAGSCVPFPARTTPPELVAGGEEPLAARPPDGPRPPAAPRPSSVAFASRVGHLWSVEPQLQHPSPIGRSEASKLCASPRGDRATPVPTRLFSTAPPQGASTTLIIVDCRPLLPWHRLHELYYPIRVTTRVFELHSTPHVNAKAWWRQTR